MSQQTRVKICGLKDTAHIDAAAQAGAAYVGFVFFPKSPRNVSIAQAVPLAGHVPLGVAKVALTVNADNDALDAITGAVPLDMLQLHGAETPARVAEVKARYGLPVMKAIGVAEAADLAQIDEYAPVADQLLIDAKPAPDSDRPGGNGLPFDWQLLAGRKYWTKPWMLSGGLTADNVSRAINLTGAKQIDLSSGVETAPGVKDAGLIRTFMDAVKGPPALR
ncbi:N-(5'-phosphoribosyl)anthranilate isomerase [Actibacterium mucosum KCTC 23349]|uniref:N-(5'-phosphoribosyl)anthranilate isomerase n=1 Tax=Actibacterium mucosum KCTC 23349 TaxID=1454373 RepID=A0A037ZK75_9RHOB|nr:phosphoribosylanthranilate isomerase [Actibacterium mucosum]KAJ55927.1 N-(5'-phosphoribosyl)anthranilate isomerase [Actibacterium mucosum KCTC 23349]